MYPFHEINAFVVNNGSVQHFAADLSLYKKVFPQSELIVQFEKTHDLKKKEIDERMLVELLKSGKVKIENIVDNRIKLSKEVKKTEAKTTPPKTKTTDTGIDPKAIEKLKASDIDKLKYNAKKSLVFKLKLQVKDNSGDTYTEALKAAQEEYGVKKN